MKINNNIQALNAYRNLNKNQFATSKNLEKLSSGLRINRAADDAAGLAISEKMRSQIRGLKQAERNSLDGISLMQTAEGALQEVHEMLQRMRELAVQGANDTNTKYDREQIQKEIEQLKLEIDSISEKTEFNTRKLLNGSSAVLSSINEVADNAAALVGNPKVIDPRLETDTYHVKVENTEEIVKLNQVGAGIANKDDIRLDSDPNGEHYPQAFGEYTINVRSFLSNPAPDGTTQYSATIQVVGPDGLPIEERSVSVFSSNENGEYISIGGIEINTSSIKEAGTIKASIEQQATFSVYRGDSADPANKIAAEKTMTTIDGIVRHGGIEFKFDNKVSAATGGTQAVPAVAGEYELELDLSSWTPGQTIEIDSVSFEYDDNFTDLTTLINAINTDPTLNAKYTATDVDGKIVLTQLPGEESATAPTIGGTGNSNLETKTPGQAAVPAIPGDAASTKFSVTNNALAFQIGPNTNQNVMIDVPRLDIVTLGIEEIDVTTQEGANKAIFTLDQAINILSDVRAKLGATQNRMEHTINNLQVTHENLSASESRIRDADMALEMTEFTRNNILNQSATAMLAQANQLPQGVLQLLQ